MSSEAHDRCFSHFAEVTDIKNGTESDQYFLLHHVKCHDACRKFLKLQVCRNWGGSTNRIHSLSILGVMQEDAKKIIDYLVKSIQWEKQNITDRDAYLSSIGVKFKDKWQPLVAEHPLLFETTAFRSRKVIQRLSDELKMRELDYLGIIAMKKSFIFDASSIRFQQGMPIPDWISSNLPRSSFTISVNKNDIPQIFHFEDIRKMSLPIHAPIADFDAVHSVVSLRVHSRNGSFKPKVVAEATVHRHFARYEIVQQKPLCIDRTVEVTVFDEGLQEEGSIDIHCTSDIVVTKNGVITANGAGLKRTEQSIVYAHFCERNNPFLAFGNMLYRKNYGQSATTTVEGGGGIIALRSAADIINDGLLSSNGVADGRYSGGTIYLCAKGGVVNLGQIECTPYGRVIVQCRGFVNEGVISPEPDVQICSDVDIHQLPPFGQISRLLTTLSSHRNRVTYSKAFVKRHALQFDPEWVPLISTHCNLMKVTAYNQWTVLRRLVDEFQLKVLSICAWKEHIGICGSVICLAKDVPRPDWLNDALPFCTFSVSVDGVPMAKEFKFDRHWKFEIPIAFPKLDPQGGSSTITLNVKQNLGHSHFFPIKTMEIQHHRLFSQYGMISLNSKLFLVVAGYWYIDESTGRYPDIITRSTRGLHYAPFL